MINIPPNFVNQPVSDGAEPPESTISANGKAAATLNITSNDPDLGQVRDALKPSFKLPAPDHNSAAGDLDATVQHIANLSNSIQTDIFAFMNLFFQMALETRKTASEIRTAEREAKFKELQNAADKIRGAGLWQMAAGIAGGVTSMASGALNIAGGLKSLKAATGEIGGVKSERLPDRPIELSDLDPNQSPLNPNMAQIQAQAVSQQFSGIGTSVQGAGQIASAGLNYGASLAQAEQKEHETKAEKDQAQVDMANELFQNMQQTIQDVLSKLEAIQQSSNDTHKQILRA